MKKEKDNSKQKQLMIDIEGKTGIPGYARYTDGKQVEIVLAGKYLISISESEKQHRIYKLLKETFHLTVCSAQNLNDFNFYPIPLFAIFAVDHQKNCLGMMGGIGDIDQDDYPIGYIDCEGMCLKIANSLNEFLQLVIFYPFWQDIIQCDRMGLSYDIKIMEEKYIELNSQYLAHQSEAAKILNVTKNSKSIELLLYNIKCKPELTIYPSKEEAKKTNSFATDLEKSAF